MDGQEFWEFTTAERMDVMGRPVFCFFVFFQIGETAPMIMKGHSNIPDGKGEIYFFYSSYYGM